MVPNFTGKDKAAKTYEWMTRDMWSTYVSQFIPIENELIRYATDAGQVSTNQAMAMENVNQAFQAQQGATQRRLRGMGMELDPEEQKAADRSMGLSRSLAEVGAANMAGRQTMERQRSIIGNPAPNPGQM
jgi:hypothetical protein